MDHITQADFTDVSVAAHAVLNEEKSTGVWVVGGGINEQQRSQLLVVASKN
jgi:hypothetical protein